LYNFKCYTDSEIVKRYGEILIVGMKYQSNYVDPKSFDKPVDKIFDKDHYYIQSTKIHFKYIFSFLRLDTYSGLIFNNSSSVNFIQFNKILVNVRNMGLIYCKLNLLRGLLTY